MIQRDATSDLIESIERRMGTQPTGCMFMPHCTVQVNSVHCNPADPNLVVTASNDWTARLFDLRCLPSADTHALPKGEAASPAAFACVYVSLSALVCGGICVCGRVHVRVCAGACCHKTFSGQGVGWLGSHTHHMCSSRLGTTTAAAGWAWPMPNEHLMSNRWYAPASRPSAGIPPSCRCSSLAHWHACKPAALLQTQSPPCDSTVV